MDPLETSVSNSVRKSCLPDLSTSRDDRVGDARQYVVQGGRNLIHRLGLWEAVSLVCLCRYHSETLTELLQLSNSVVRLHLDRWSALWQGLEPVNKKTKGENVWVKSRLLCL